MVKFSVYLNRRVFVMFCGPPEGDLDPWLPTKCHAKTLIRLRESTYNLVGSDVSRLNYLMNLQVLIN